MDHFCPLQGWLGLNVGGLDFLQIAGLAAGQDSDGTKLFDVGRNFMKVLLNVQKKVQEVFQLAHIFLIIRDIFKGKGMDASSQIITFDNKYAKKVWFDPKEDADHFNIPQLGIYT